MLEAAREAVSFAQGRSRDDLNRDRMLVLSLVKAIEIAGEAAFQISEPMRNELPDLPWADIIGMRHRLVQVDLPVLIAQIEQLPFTERA
jgi:uncharacterized protein with HEPN domain